MLFSIFLYLSYYLKRMVDLSTTPYKSCRSACYFVGGLFLVSETLPNFCIFYQSCKKRGDLPLNILVEKNILLYFFSSLDFYQEFIGAWAKMNSGCVIYMLMNTLFKFLFFSQLLLFRFLIVRFVDDTQDYLGSLLKIILSLEKQKCRAC